MIRVLYTCTVPGCSALTTSGRCAAHRRAADQRRGSSAERGYGASWRRLRLVVLRRDPYCTWPGCCAPASEVDHIVPLRDGGSNELTNLRGLCKPHHSERTAREHGGWGDALR